MLLLWNDYLKKDVNKTKKIFKRRNILWKKPD